MEWIQTIIIAIVEGLTEFLPVSSTGHIIITQGLLGMESTPFWKAFAVIIQFGAILSVVCLYWRKFFYPETMRTKGYTWWQAIRHFYLRLIIGVLPAVVLGFTLNEYIEKNLGNVTLVAVMLIVGGVFMLFCDRLFNKGSDSTPLTLRRSFVIGCFQCISMIPGVSRSMATIVGGMAQKLTRKAAAEFSFFLAVPTMAGATLLEVVKLVKGEEGNVLTQGNNLSLLLLGCVVSFIVATLAIKGFIAFLTKYGFAAFGWYRIIVGVLILVMGMLGYELTMD
ncbi:MAG: undecaprenyl-diphosphate phosphatase [Bacteroidales bacterium]|nr:undecaprenyl-diphosphate phosphatase [Bacteroidales bacterium]